MWYLSLDENKWLTHNYFFTTYKLKNDSTYKILSNKIVIFHCKIVKIDQLAK